MDYTQAEHEAKMTIFYSKSTGEVKCACSGIQDFKMYGIDAEDFSIIWAFIVMDIDNYVIQNSNKFIIDLTGDKPVLSIKKEEVDKYPVASI